MLQARGHKVTGSDQNVYPPMSTQLEALGIEIMNGYQASNADVGADCVVVGNTISRGNPELEEILNRKVLYRSQAEIVKEEFIRGRRSLVIAGTHGKTTTTSIAAWVCEVGGLDPSFLVGGIVQNFGASFRVTGGDHFVIEGDEYDTAYFDKKPKFMHYLPEIAIVNNIEFDHADIYRDLEEIEFQFSRLMNLVPGNGRLIVGIDSPVAAKVLDEMRPKLHTQIETFGTSDEAKWQARYIDFTGDLTRFTVFREGHAFPRVRDEPDRGIQCQELPGSDNRGGRVGDIERPNTRGFQDLQISQAAGRDTRGRAGRHRDRRFCPSSRRRSKKL